MHTRSFAAVLATIALLLAALGCRDDTTAPTEPASMSPQASVSAATTLAFWELSAGVAHTCSVTTDNRAYCWGDNDYGRLGDGTTTLRAAPVPVIGGLHFRQISAGVNHTCGVTTDFRAFCWGWNYAGQLGDGSTANRLGPVPVAGGHLFRTVEAGFMHSCGMSYPDNRAFCWGRNNRGQLGNGTTTSSLTPVAVSGARQFRQVTIGYYHSCGVTADNWAYCWGDNQYGEVGDSSDAWKRLKPVRIAGTRQYRQIDGGSYHTCAVTPDNRAYCWGRNDAGQIGDGTMSSRRWPKAVAGGLYFRRVTAGGGSSWGNTCGETSGSLAYCWGYNGYGGVGDGTATTRLKPVAVVGGLSFAQMSAGTWYACGKTTTAVGYCWGWNSYGQLGDGTTTSRLTPTPIAGAM